MIELIIIGITAIAFVVYKITKGMYPESSMWVDNLSFSSAAVSIAGCIILVIMLAASPIVRFKTYQSIEQFKSVELTVQMAQENGFGIEDAALITEIIKSNKWLSGMKYTDSIVDWFIPDEVLELEPIELKKEK